MSDRFLLRKKEDDPSEPDQVVYGWIVRDRLSKNDRVAYKIDDLSTAHIGDSRLAFTRHTE